MTVEATRNAAKQDRSRRTEQALVSAALELFRERGFDDVTVGEIADAAGVAPATIYRRFLDKEGLTRQVYRQFTVQAREVIAAEQLTEGRGSFVEVIAAVTERIMRFVRENRRFLQAAYVRALSDDYYAAELVELRTSIFLSLRRQILARKSEIGHPNPARAVDFALRQAVAMLSARVEAGKLDVTLGPLTERDFLRELFRSILGYLQVPFSTEEIDDALAAREL